jgi:hypothetical protein
MNCLECSTTITRAAIGCCAQCGAAVCGEHADFIVVRPEPVMVAQSVAGMRRLTCTICQSALVAHGPQRIGTGVPSSRRRIAA